MFFEFPEENFEMIKKWLLKNYQLEVIFYHKIGQGKVGLRDIFVPKKCKDTGKKKS